MTKPTQVVTVTAAFIVGNNFEWWYGRCRDGDIALYHTLHSYISQNNKRQYNNLNKNSQCDLMEFIHEYDLSTMTVAQLQERLSNFLNRINGRYRTSTHSSNDNVMIYRIQFVLYIGGHGEVGYYCWTAPHCQNQTTEAENYTDDTDDTGTNCCWYYKDIVALLQQKLLPSDTVYFLVDACYSGSVIHALDRWTRGNDNNNNNDDDGDKRTTADRDEISQCTTPKWYTTLPNGTARVSFLIFMSTQDDCTAGPEWTLTQAWIQAMVSQYQGPHWNSRGNHHRQEKYSVQWDGIHSSSHQQDSHPQQYRASPQSINNVVYTIHDKIYTTKQNEMQFSYVYNPNNTPTYAQPPLDLDTTTFPFGIDPPLLPPEPCRVAHLDENNKPCHRPDDMRWHASSQPQNDHGIGRRWSKWIRTFRKNRNINLQHHHHYQMMAFRLLANNGQYRYYSNTTNTTTGSNGSISMWNTYKNRHFVVGTKVWCLWENDTQLYLGTIMDDDEVSWDDFLPTNTTDDDDDDDDDCDTFRFSITSTSLPNFGQCHGIGPCIPVRWDLEQSWSFLPIGQCYPVQPDTSANETPQLDVVQEYASTIMREVMQEQFVIPTTTTTTAIAPPTLSIPMDCLLRSFYSMGKELCFVGTDIYHDTMLSGQRWTTKEMVHIASTIKDMDTLCFEFDPNSSGRDDGFIQYLMDDDSINKYVDHMDGTTSHKNRRQIAQSYYLKPVTSTIRSIYDVHEDMLLTHVWWNTTASLERQPRVRGNSSSGGGDDDGIGTIKYCIMRVVVMVVSSTHPNHHCTTDSGRLDSTLPPHPFLLERYCCIPISSLRITNSMHCPNEAMEGRSTL